MAKLIVANWKMNPQSAKEAERILAGYEKQLTANSYKLLADVVVCPPFVYLNQLPLRVCQLADSQSLDSRLRGNDKVKLSVKLGAQDVFWENSGAYTGEISPMMLKDLGCEYVLIGHSERRRYFGETDEMINKKVRAGLEAGLKAILCVGEPLEIREKGKKAVEDFIGAQLEKDLNGIEANNLTIAYEPIWAIGTGHFDTSKDAAEIIKFIKDILNSRFQILYSMILYGGSVNGENAKDFLSQDSIDGLLVGGASLDPDEFAKIIKSV